MFCFSIDSHCWCLRPHLLPCLELAETKGTVFGVNLTWTQNHPPQLQAPASIQINTLQTVLSLSFFHYKILYFLPFAIEAHIIKYPAVLFLGQTKTQQKTSPFPILWRRMENPDIRRCPANWSGWMQSSFVDGGRQERQLHWNQQIFWQIACNIFIKLFRMLWFTRVHPPWIAGEVNKSVWFL